MKQKHKQLVTSFGRKNFAQKLWTKLAKMLVSKSTKKD